MRQAPIQVLKNDWYCFAVILACFVVVLGIGSLTQGGDATEFPGTVVTVDQAMGKFAVKKESGGTRFTFVANEKTKFQGAGLASLKDLKKDDKVVVLYRVQGPQYIALSVTKQK
jgi:hypothetical protein